MAAVRRCGRAASARAGGLRARLRLLDRRALLAACRRRRLRADRLGCCADIAGRRPARHADRHANLCFRRYLLPVSARVGPGAALCAAYPWPALLPRSEEHTSEL